MALMGDGSGLANGGLQNCRKLTQPRIRRVEMSKWSEYALVMGKAVVSVRLTRAGEQKVRSPATTVRISDHIC
jgi:hypothetical protein